MLLSLLLLYCTREGIDRPGAGGLAAVGIDQLRYGFVACYELEEAEDEEDAAASRSFIMCWSVIRIATTMGSSSGR